MNPEQHAGYKLLETGALVEFEVIEQDVQNTAVADSLTTRIEIQLGEEDVEWGAFSFLFCLAVLSFADARPRGASEVDFVAEDEFTVADLFDCLHYERGELRFSADYVRGRCMKMDITVRPDGRIALATRQRGEAALRWVDRLKGKKMMKLME